MISRSGFFDWCYFLALFPVTLFFKNSVFFVWLDSLDDLSLYLKFILLVFSPLSSFTVESLVTFEYVIWKKSFN